MGSQRESSALRGPLRGSEAIAAGLVTRKKLAGARYQRVFRDVYLPATAVLTHELRCECAALVLPADAVITGRSAATLRGVPLGLPHDPIRWSLGWKPGCSAGLAWTCGVVRFVPTRRSPGRGFAS